MVSEGATDATGMWKGMEREIGRKIGRKMNRGRKGWYVRGNAVVSSGVLELFPCPLGVSCSKEISIYVSIFPELAVYSED